MTITSETAKYMLFAFSALVYSILMFVLYMKKKKVMTLENILCVVFFICLIFQLIVNNSNFLITKSELFSRITKQLHNSLFILWGGLVTLYFIVTVSKENPGYIAFKDSPKKPYFMSLIKKYIIFLICVWIPALFLPQTPGEDGLYMVSHGIAPTYCYAVFGIFIVSWFILFFKAPKEIKKRIMPMTYVLFIGVIGAVIQIFLPHLYITCAITALATHIIYLSIANPDLNMIEDLNMAREGVERANKAKSEFLSNMTHEIRTPLNAIVGFSEALSEEEMSAENKEDVEIINNSAVNLLDIVNGILDISKIDSGKLEVTKSTYILNKLINEVIVVANKRKGEKPIEIKANVNKDLPQVLNGDAIKVRTILTSILSNAVKYTESGKVTIDVDGYVKEDKIRLIINIEDSGKGIKKETLPTLFTSYELGEKSGTIEGSGLGVALTKKLVELMGGKIHVKSGEGVGTSFIIGIDQDIIAKTSNEVEGIYSEELEIYDLSGKKILVVDDNGVNLKVAKRLLKEYKIEVDLAESGQECIDKVKTNKYDLIMMDDFMPVMDGPTTLTNLKQIEGFNIPVIALTANSESDSKSKYVGLGFNNYLAKPIVKEELNKELKEFLV